MFIDTINNILKTKHYAYNLLNYVDDDEFQQQLIEYGSSRINRLINNNINLEDDYELILLTMTYVALRYYDGGFWKKFHELFRHLGYSQQVLEMNLRNKFLYFIAKKYNCNRKYYQIPVMEAIVPLRYADDFFEFVHDIYVKNLNCDLINYNLDEEIEFVFNGIKDKLTDDDKAFDYKFENDSVKTYKLIQAIKNIIKTGLNIEELKIFTTDVLRKIDAYYNGKDVYINSYISLAFEEWRRNFPIFDLNTKKMKNGIIKTFSPFFELNESNGQVYLYTPTKRLFGEYDVDLFRINIFENGKLIFVVQNLNVNYLLGGFEICSKKILVKSPLNNISCKIMYDEELIYDSKNLLYRDYLIFNEKKEITYSTKGHFRLTYFIYKNDFENIIEEIYKFDNYYFGYKYIEKEKEHIYLDNNLISFANSYNNLLVGTYNQDLEIIYNNYNLKIYSKIEHIYLVTSQYNKKIYKLKINDKFISDYNDIQIIDQKNNYAYFIDFNKLSFNIGYNKIELFNLSNSHVDAKFEFFYDPFIHTKQLINKDYNFTFYYEGSYKLIDKKNNFIDSIELNIAFPNHKNKYKIVVNEIEYPVKFIVNVPYYYIDDENVSPFSYSIDDIKRIKTNSKLFFKVPNCTNVKYFYNNLFYDLTIKTIEKNTYVEVGELLNIRDTKKIEIIFYEYEKKIEVLNVFLDIIFDCENSFYVVDPIKQQLTAKSVINGLKTDDFPYIKLTTKNDIIIDEAISYDTKINIVNLGSKITKIKLEIYVERKKNIGFKTKTVKEVIFSDEFRYYPYDDLMNKYLLIDKVDIGYDDGDDDEIDQNMNNLYMKLIKKIEEFTYIGYFYKKIDDKIVALDGDVMKISLLSQYKINDDEYIESEAYIYYDDSEDDYKDLLQYDIKNDKILESYNSIAPFITKYKINLSEGGKQYARAKSDRKS